jgi:hypothetical protein
VSVPFSVCCFFFVFEFTWHIPYTVVQPLAAQYANRNHTAPCLGMSMAMGITVSAVIGYHDRGICCIVWYMKRTVSVIRMMVCSVRPMTNIPAGFMRAAMHFLLARTMYTKIMMLSATMAADNIISKNLSNVIPMTGNQPSLCSYVACMSYCCSIGVLYITRGYVPVQYAGVWDV